MLGLSGFERSGAPGLRKIWSGGAIFHEFGQVGEIRRLGSTRFWRVWQLGCDFSSVWASRGDSQVRRHAVLEGLAAGVRAASASRARAARSEPPPTHPEVGVSASQAVRGVFGCGWGPTTIVVGW